MGKPGKMKWKLQTSVFECYHAHSTPSSSSVFSVQVRLALKPFVWDFQIHLKLFQYAFEINPEIGRKSFLREREKGNAVIIIHFIFSSSFTAVRVQNPWIWLVNRARSSGPDYPIRTLVTDHSEIPKFGNVSSFLLHHKTAYNVKNLQRVKESSK